jgi:hypothetical protein
MGKEMFIMQKIRKQRIVPNVNMDAMHAYNKMHLGYRVQIEWGIGRLKRKWKRFMKRFDSTKPKYSYLFKLKTLLTNSLHRRKMDFTYKVIGHHLLNLEYHIWATDF